MNNPKTVVVLGKFDGVHIAHAKLIGTAVDVASRLGAKSLVYSMHRSDAPSITDNDKKLNIINSLGADRVVFKELNEEFMMLSAEGIIIRLRTDEISSMGRSTQGVTLMKVDEGDRVVGMARVVSNDVSAKE